MVKTLVEADTDPATAQVEEMMTEAEEQAELAKFTQGHDGADLSDGGMIGGVKLTPMAGGRRLQKGRPAARLAWMWNGTETVLPIAYNPEGTVSDKGLRYMSKRHCLCCRQGGFRGLQCPNCVKNSCTQCKSSTDRQTERELGNGTKMRGWIIPCFYLQKEKVPFPARFYGSIDCFLPFCVRRGERGFLTEQDMRLHARSRHRMEYQAHMDALAAARTDEVAELRQRLDALITSRAGTAVLDRPSAPRERMAKARTAKRNKRRETP